MALPHDLQLHRRMPSWHPGHEGHPGSQAGAVVHSLTAFGRSPDNAVQLQRRGPERVRAFVCFLTRSGVTFTFQITKLRSFRNQSVTICR
ncbi:hypothetical protein RHCRD62_110048 [Rhodococcus sp. RD6.2]|nr:hypothetical protein RHCRD62_110048 [Rhodococcus sp. RD6.2]